MCQNFVFSSFLHSLSDDPSDVSGDPVEEPDPEVGNPWTELTVCKVVQSVLPAAAPTATC